MRYKLRSSSQQTPTSSSPAAAASSTSPPSPKASPSSTSPEKMDELEANNDLAATPAAAIPAAAAAGSESDASQTYCSPPKKPRLPVRRRKKTHKAPSTAAAADETAFVPGEEEVFRPDTRITDLPSEVLLHVGHYLDAGSLLNLFQTCRWFHSMFADCNAFWKAICTKEELANYPCLLSDDEDPDGDDAPVAGGSGGRSAAALPRPHKKPVKYGWMNKPMHVSPPREYPSWRRVFLKGIQMRKNIWQSNYEGWRIFANPAVPVVKLTPDLDLNVVKRRMGNFQKLSENDDLKIDWDERHLVVFHFFRGEGESCVIQLWDISESPRFVSRTQKGLECITDKVSVVNDHVVIVPSWPLEARAVVMTLDIKNDMSEVGKFIFQDEERRAALDDKWEHTQLRVIKNEAMVVCRCPDWTLVVVELPSCTPLYEIKLGDVANTFDCQQIRSYKQMAIIMFSRKQNDASNILVTVDVAGKDTKVRSTYPCSDVADVAVFTDPEEIFIMKRNGDVVMFDANLKTETVKIANDEPAHAHAHSSNAAASSYIYLADRTDISKTPTC